MISVNSGFFVHFICIIMLYLHLNDIEISETKCFIPRRFELDTTSVRKFGLLRPGVFSGRKIKSAAIKSVINYNN